MTSDPHHPHSPRHDPAARQQDQSGTDSTCSSASTGSAGHTTDPYPTDPTVPATASSAPTDTTLAAPAAPQPAHTTRGTLFELTGHALLPRHPSPHQLGCALATDLLTTRAAVPDRVWNACQALAHLEHLADSLDEITGIEHALRTRADLESWQHPLRHAYQRTLMRACACAITHNVLTELNRLPQCLTLRSTGHYDTQPRCSCGRWLPRTTTSTVAGHPYAGQLDTRLTRIWWPDLGRHAHTHTHDANAPRPHRPHTDSALHRARPTRAPHMTRCVFSFPVRPADHS